MTRHHFQINKPYAAKLIRVALRPIENDPNASLQLIRLEFSVYWIVGDKKLESQGEIACRDLVVGMCIDANRDAGLIAYAQALRVAAPINVAANWTNLTSHGRWIEVTFGPAETEGGRNPFATIKPFNSAGCSVTKYRYDRNAKWVTIKAAADAVQTSESTVRRRVDALESHWGARLVHRTEGDHRRIFLPLFVNIWED